jgi:NADH:ubiquinone oxidoreductase subunit 6 (subunit J)
MNQASFGIPVSLFASVAIGWHEFFFLLFAAIACVSALMVVLSDNVVRMALHLVLSLGATAGLFFLAGAEFVGAMQLMIYVGGTLVLLVFGVMLTAQTQLVSLRTPAGDRVIASILAAALLAVLVQAAYSIESWQKPGQGMVSAPTATPLGMALVGVRVDQHVEEGLLEPKGGYLLPFEIVSVHLLVVLIGAAYLARAKRRRVPRPVDLVASVDSVKPTSSLNSDTILSGGSE